MIWDMLSKYHSKLKMDNLEEVKKVQRDLLYVALTRAISELHIMGKIKLKETK